MSHKTKWSPEQQNIVESKMIFFCKIWDKKVAKIILKREKLSIIIFRRIKNLVPVVL